MPKPKATQQPDAAARIQGAALALAGRQGWRNTGLAEIAEEAGLRLHEVYAVYRSKGAILAGFLRRIDAAVLAGAEREGEPQDRLFDTLMRRFEALKPYRPGLHAVLRDGAGTPGALFAAPLLLRSMAWMLEASGISASGCRGRLRAHVLAGLYLSLLRVFFADTTEDLARTMAALDQRLRRARGWLGLGERRAGPAAEAAA
jgi:AcrR family transcriptional regulator